MSRRFIYTYEDPSYDNDDELFWEEEYADDVVKKPQISIDRFEKRSYNKHTGKSPVNINTQKEF